MTDTLAFLRQNLRWLIPGMLLTFLSCFGQTFFISLFAGEIRAAYDLSHSAWGNIYATGTLASAVLMVWAGVLTDHFRVRSLGAVVLALLIAACLAMAGAHAAWTLPFVIFALRFSGQGMLSHIAVVAMARWFVATRGRALAIAGLGFSFGEAILPIAVVSVLSAETWRSIWIIAACVVFAGIPTLIWLLNQERTPKSMAASQHVAGMGGLHWTRRAALSHGLFWVMVPALIGPSAFNTAFFFQQVPFAEIKGWQHFELVAFFPVFTLTGILAMLVAGWAIDRFGTAKLLPWFQLPLVAAFVLFSVANSVLGVFFGLILMGLTAGANGPLVSAFWAEFYGTRHIGAIKSAAAAVMVLGSAIGPAITGTLIDLGVGLEQQYIGVALYFLIVCAIVGAGMARYAATIAPRT
ncbi:putative 3-hydroxyphenylpropionic transporter MhpT [Shimia sp. SK013]|uniref:MFS transporter n=1 Tax=Shimia sp. SK013 TaxID=1389006 RepID=UPI0006B59E3E|nr:MFS transporter [Shimia sp. SK013]KPA19849.1 putative 3-hydroxyphenylpropionic transporter MhpT [Shimia sp. SK013]